MGASGQTPGAEAMTEIEPEETETETEIETETKTETKIKTGTETGTETETEIEIEETPKTNVETSTQSVADLSTPVVHTHTQPVANLSPHMSEADRQVPANLGVRLSAHVRAQGVVLSEEKTHRTMGLFPLTPCPRSIQMGTHVRAPGAGVESKSRRTISHRIIGILAALVRTAIAG